MTGQLAFDLPQREAWAREDFCTSPANAAALGAVEAWRDWPGGRLMLLGPAGSGKTHLAHVWAAEVGAIWLSPDDLALHLPDIPAEACVIVEDADRIAGRDETALFYLYNRLTPTGRLMLTAPAAPRDWGLALPDLLSRLQGHASRPAGGAR